MTRPVRLRLRRLLWTALFTAGCASPTALGPELNALLAQGDFAKAAARVEAAKKAHYGPKNAFLYYLDRGMLLHVAGDPAASNAAFEEAKRLAQDLFTKSVTTEASTFLVNDNLRPYAGEDFERALIHVFSALNYIFLGQPSEALVEARQVDFLLTKLETDFGHKNVYREDAFARYLAGLLYEDQGELNDAHVSYLKALEAYNVYAKNYGVQAPPTLAQDALRTARRLGMTDRVAEIQKRWDVQIPAPWPEDAGEVVVLHYNGLPPHKVDSFFEIGFVKGWTYVDAAQPAGDEAKEVEQARAVARSIAADDVVRVVFPKYEKTPYRVRRMTVQAEGAQKAHAARVVEDVGAIAEKSLKDRIARIRAKSIARAVIKFALSRKIAARVEKSQGESAGFLVKKLLQTVSTATELADKRSWQTVPDQIAMARLVLPAGRRSLSLTFQDESGAPLSERTIENVEVRPGRRTFVVARTAL